MDLYVARVRPVLQHPPTELLFATSATIAMDQGKRVAVIEGRQRTTDYSNIIEKQDGFGRAFPRDGWIAGRQAELVMTGKNQVW